MAYIAGPSLIAYFTCWLCFPLSFFCEVLPAPAPRVGRVPAIIQPGKSKVKSISSQLVRKEYAAPSFWKDEEAGRLEEDDDNALTLVDEYVDLCVSASPIPAKYSCRRQSSAEIRLPGLYLGEEQV